MGNRRDGGAAAQAVSCAAVRVYTDCVTVTVLSPDAARLIAPALIHTRSPHVWVYKYEKPDDGWTLSVATHAEPGSGKLSLGGFRIAPAERVAMPGFTPEGEAIALAIGMEEKVWWSRITGIGGPRAKAQLSRIVGGKCVLAPSPDARVGQPRDTELLDFAIEAFRSIEETGGIYLITGQDLGHGDLHTGESSLEYLNARYRGSVRANTSVSTGEGNVRLLLGMLQGADLRAASATVGLVGCGNIGMHVLTRLRGLGLTPLVLESNPARRAELQMMGIPLWSPEQRDDFLSQPMDALVVNALGGSLNPDAVAVCVRNERLRVICGSENLVMPDASQSDVLRDAGKVYAPTELGGMVGYLTAVEAYLCKQAGAPFKVEDMFAAAAELEPVGMNATQRVLAGGNRESFEDAVVALYSTPAATR